MHSVCRRASAVPLAFGKSAFKDRRTGAGLSAWIQLAAEMLDWNFLELGDLHRLEYVVK